MIENMVTITGSNGFVGRNLTSYLIHHQIKVDVINRSDLYNLNPTLLKGVKSIIHLAGKAHDLKNISNSNEYYQVNTKLSQNIFDAFLASEAKVFITLSSVKAVSDVVDGELSEKVIPSPITHYGKSKFLAEQYIFSKEIPEGKRVYILRPCMIHGPGNKGNLNLLYKFVSKGWPWPLGDFENRRSFCSIDNLLFVFKELIERDDIPSGIYNIADDEPLSTNKLIQMMSKSQGRSAKIWNISNSLISTVAKIGDKLYLPLNTERLQKLTNSYVVCNVKLVKSLGKPLPVSSREGLMKTFNSFNI